MARGPLPGGKEEKDNDSTPVAFDVNDGNGGKVVEVNGECEGNGNSDGPIDNNNDDNYDKEQPGCTYYFSPLSIYNLGVVDHTHIYNDGWVSEHLYCHVYTDGIGKKGANNVA